MPTRWILWPKPISRWARLNEAIAKYQEALAVKPDFLTSNFCIAYIHALKENPAEAMAWLETFISPGARCRLERRRDRASKDFINAGSAA